MERAIEALRDVPGLVKLHKGDSLLGKVRGRRLRVWEGQGDKGR